MFALWIAKDGRFLFSLEDNGGVSITEEEHSELLSGQSLGQQIVPDAEGSPVLIDPAQ